MATNILQKHISTLTLVAPSGGVVSGTPKFIGSFFCVPLASAAAGDEFAARVQGVATLAKKTNLTISQGDMLYWSSSNAYVTKTTTDTPIGIAAADASLNATTVDVMFSPMAASDAEIAGVQSDLAAHVADTSAAHAASAISVLDSGNKITATDAEGALVENATAIQDHVADTSAAHAASAISVLDSGDYYTGSNAEAVLAEVGEAMASQAGSLWGTYQITFVGSNGAAHISPTVRTNGVTPKVGDKIVMLIGYVTATGAKVAMPTLKLTDFDDDFVDDGGVKVNQLNAGNLSGNTYEALVIPS